MVNRSHRVQSWFAGIAALSLVAFVCPNAVAQQAAAPNAQAIAPIDLTGYWVSVVTEDWRWRMVTPAPGDHSSVPLTLEGRRVTDGWNPAKDLAEGNACKAYGAAGIMRMPGRL
ncbi:MAG: hypothetical protein HY657_06345, partial [Acidobacteria bacterium]|nr:hypothetical protein [Acidobacteriota bacterium]